MYICIYIYIYIYIVNISRVFMSDMLPICVDKTALLKDMTSVAFVLNTNIESNCQMRTRVTGYTVTSVSLASPKGFVISE